MDTVIEVMVFSAAAMGVLTLLVRGYNTGSTFLPKRENVAVTREFHDEAIEDVKDTTSLSTPFTRLVARLVLPLSLLIALSHIITGGHSPGDGFTAGAISGLAISLWFVVFGYNEAKERLQFYAPQRLMRIGMLIVVGNGILPIIFGLHSGTFLAHVDYGKLIGISEVLHRFGLELTSGLFYEIGIALAVLGGFGAIMEAIAHPKAAADLDFDPTTTSETMAIED
jgi:multicomponent K+:H+ antiporter subunit A